MVENVLRCSIRFKAFEMALCLTQPASRCLTFPDRVLQGGLAVPAASLACSDLAPDWRAFFFTRVHKWASCLVCRLLQERDKQRALERRHGAAVLEEQLREREVERLRKEDLRYQVRGMRATG